MELYPSEQGHIQKIDDTKTYNAECIHCGETDHIELWPHRNGHGGMVGFIFLCSGCKELAPNIEIEIKGIRLHKEKT